MPYIKQSERSNRPLVHNQQAGNLNYTLSQEVDRYLWENGLSYATLNNVVGVLECLKLEVYRRIAAPYEDKKLEENGDVFHVNFTQG